MENCHPKTHKQCQKFILAKKSRKPDSHSNPVSLQKQYEQYLINLWGVKRNQAYPTSAQHSVSRTPSTMASTHTAKYMNYNYPIQTANRYQYYDASDLINNNNTAGNREIKSDLVKCLSATNMSNTPAPYNYNYHQDISANPIKSNDENENFFRNEFPSSSTLLDEAKHFQFTSTYLQQQQSQQQSHKFNNTNNEFTSSIILDDSQLQKPQNLTFDIKSTKSFNPMCQQNKPHDNIEKLSANYGLYSGMAAGNALHVPQSNPISSSSASTGLQEGIAIPSTSGMQTVSAKSVPKIVVRISDDEDTEDSQFDEKNVSKGFLKFTKILNLLTFFQLT